MTNSNPTIYIFARDSSTCEIVKFEDVAKRKHNISRISLLWDNLDIEYTVDLKGWVDIYHADKFFDFEDKDDILCLGLYKRHRHLSNDIHMMTYLLGIETKSGNSDFIEISEDGSKFWHIGRRK